ncbi:hypothetical protein GOP47_0019318 [Adiantum capillus-veneris]|uniref:Uncharacterized protein n=1 Tax=Adiantum capillus-veneris TaxID=13818 RepID=A0A9D4UEX2_ADICA|nr:hypothetical protein GOP47_0019318 [Adiantum capillus-veneris]
MLLAQYEEDRHVHVDKEDIAASIFHLTGGHKGLVGVCCAELHTAFLSQSNRTLEMWERFSKQNLVRHVFVKPTYYSIISVCAGLDEKGTDLILCLLRSERCVTMPYDDNVECLISEGVLVDNSPDSQLCELNISSLLLHAALLESLQLHLSTKVVPGPHVFDHLWIITKTIERLNWSIFQIPESQNADQLASEYSIQFEFYVKMKAVLVGAYSASKWLVIPEAKPAAADKRKRLDIFVRDGERNRWFGVELLRQGTPTSLQDHYKRSFEYAATHRCIVYMLNFILKEKSCVPSFSSAPAGDVICYDVFCGPSPRMVGGYTGDGCFIERPLNLENGDGKLSLFSNDFTG